MKLATFFVLTATLSGVALAAEVWPEHISKPGANGWRCNVVQADPEDHGPDGINIHDWDCDGQLDLFVNYEEGKYSRLYFNPGKHAVRDPWPDFVEFTHGNCEDSGMGDLDNDGDIDYIANGGWVYFNPGKSNVRHASRWTKMTLFNEEQRVPTVFDVDGDGLNDLIVGASKWYKQPEKEKHKAENWVDYRIGKNRWPMNCIMNDVDGDGDADMVVPDRGVETCWYVNPGKDKVTGEWERKTLHAHHEPMFMTVADVNGDRIDDFVITGGSRGTLAKKLIILLRTNKSGVPTFKELVIDQPCGNFPKGVAAMDLDGDPRKSEIVVIPKEGDIWTTTYVGDSMQADRWRAAPIRVPGAQTRKKMDNVYLGDLDGDGDLDIATTEENGGWGVIWFENPANN
ncbi:MAG: hypothetical protein ACI856_000910 [Kiritimatiellia bacterium]|jgi:hypothetical protein